MADCQFAETTKLNLPPSTRPFQVFPGLESKLITHSFLPEFQDPALAEALEHFSQFKRCCRLTGQCPWIKILFGITKLLQKLNILVR